MKQKLTHDELTILKALQAGATPWTEMVNQQLPVDTLPALEKLGLVKKI